MAGLNGNAAAIPEELLARTLDGGHVESAEERRVLRDLESWISDRMGFANRYAKGFKGTRDYFKVFGYKSDLVFADFRERYERDSIAGRIVDLPAETTWQTPPAVADSKAGKRDTKFEKAFIDLARRLKLWRVFERADRVAGIGRYAVIVLGFRDNGSLDIPVTGVEGPEDVLYASVYSEGDAVIKKLDTEPTSERFGLPETYDIDFSRSGETSGTGKRRIKSKPVHWSRVIHIAEHCIEDEVYGTPRLMRVWNLLDDVLKLSGGSAETFWLTANRGMLFKLDPNTRFRDEDEKEKLKQQAELYAQGLTRILRGRGLDVEVLGSASPNPRGAFGVVSALIIGATGIPLRLLFGTERGQIATVQDRTTWMETIMGRQTNFAEPDIVRPTLDRLIRFGALPPPNGGEYTVRWPNLLTMSPLEKAQSAFWLGRAAAEFASQAAKGKEIVRPSEAREMVFGLEADEELDDADPKIAEESGEPGKRPAGVRIAPGANERPKERRTALHAMSDFVRGTSLRGDDNVAAES